MKFDAIAKRYDLANRILSMGRDRSWRRQLAHTFRNTPNLTLLDMATGTGDQIAAFFQIGLYPSTVTGLDASDEMLHIARQKLKQISAPLSLHEGDACATDFDAETFNAITISFGLRNIPERTAFYREAHRLLTPDGQLGILEFSMPSSHLLRAFVRLYLHTALPVIGGLLTRQWKAYRYLASSIEQFPSPHSIVQELHENGFYDMHTQAVNFGLVHIITGKRVT